MYRKILQKNLGSQFFLTFILYIEKLCKRFPIINLLTFFTFILCKRKFYKRVPVVSFLTFILCIRRLCKEF